jgi:polysaccharide deacetylase 2 family uncharacterized protein YibQ
VADYTQLQRGAETLDNVLSVGAHERNQVEEREADRVADEILKRLPMDPRSHEALIKGGYELAQQMSWEVVCRDYLLPALNELK